MKRFLTLALISFVFIGYCRAQQNPSDAPATKEDVEKYLQVMHSKEMMAQTVDAMSKPMHQMIHQQFEQKRDKLPPDFERRMNKIIDEYMGGLPWDQLMDTMVPVYQRHLTKGDLEALTTFYSSPIGQKLLKEMPQIMAEAMQNMMPLLQKSIEALNQRVQQEIEAMLKESESKQAAPQVSN